MSFLKTVLKIALLGGLFTAPLFATTPFTVNVQSVAAVRPTQNVTVEFRLQNCKGGQPRVIATNTILAQLVFDFKPNAQGLATGVIYGNDEIDCGGNTNSYYTLLYIVNGVPLQSSYSYTILSTNGTFDPSVTNPISSVAAVFPPTGDNTYLRMDNSNVGSMANPFRFKGLNASTLNGTYYVDGVVNTSVESAINACIASTNAACEINATTSGQYGPAADVIWSNTGAKLDPAGKSITLLLGAYNDYVSQNSIVVTTGLTIIGRSGLLPGASSVRGTAISFPNAAADAFVLSTDSRFVHPQNVRLQNFALYGAGTGTQNGLSFDCTGVSGGIDLSLFENLQIRNFNGDSIHLPCSRYNGVGNNQNSIFSNVQAFRNQNGGYAFYAAGSTGNISFLNGSLAGGGCDASTTVYIGANNSAINPVTITSFSSSGGVITATYTGSPVAVVANQVKFTLSGFTSGYGIANLNGQLATVLTVTGQSGSVPPYSGTFTATLGTTPPNTTTVTDTGSGAFNGGTFNAYSIRFYGTSIMLGGTLVNLNGASNINFVNTHHEGCAAGTTNGLLFTSGGSNNRGINMTGATFSAVGVGVGGYIFNTNASGSNALNLNVTSTDFGTPANILIGNTSVTQAINIDTTNSMSIAPVTSGITQTTGVTTSTAGSLTLPSVKDISIIGGGAITGISGDFLPTQPFTLKQNGTWTIYQSSQTESAAIATTYACANNICVVGLHSQIPDPGSRGTITSVDAPVNGQTTYHGTFPSRWAFNAGNLYVDIVGLGNSSNNGHFSVVSMSLTTLVVANAGVGETHAGNSYLETEFVRGVSFLSSCAGFVGSSFPVIATTPSTISVYTGAVSGSGTCGANGGTFTLTTNITLGALSSVTPKPGQALEMRLNDSSGNFECVNCGVVGSTVTSPFSFIASTQAGGANYATAEGVLYTGLLPDGVTSGNAVCSAWGVSTGTLDPATALPTMKVTMACEHSTNPGLYLWQTDKAILTGNMFVPIAGSSWVTGWNVQYNSGVPFGSVKTLTLTASGTTVTTNGTAVTNGTCQAQTGATIAGVTTASVVSWSIPTALPATWQTGITVVPVVTANTVTLNLCNPTAGSITPAAQAVNIRVIQ